MSTLLRLVLGLIGALALAFVFIFVQGVFDMAEDNGTGPGTGILYQAGGLPTNNSFLLLVAILAPAILIFAIIVYVIRGKQSRGQ
jgi:hypothetical protein